MPIALKIALTCVLSYLFGSLNFAVICSHIFHHEDIREHGSGNAGITNYIRNYGDFSTIIVFIGDLGKCAAAVLIAQAVFRGDYLFEHEISNAMKFLAGLFVMLGHIWPVFFGFRGGKAVLSTAALILAFDWRMFAIGISIFIVIVVVTRYVSLGSIIAVSSILPLILIFEWNDPLVFFYMLVYACIAALVITRHIPNIKRLASHTESKFSFGHKKSSGDK